MTMKNTTPLGIGMLQLAAGLLGTLSAAETTSAPQGRELARVVPFSYFESQPLKIGNDIQLLVDDYIIEDRWKLTRRTGPVNKYIGNPVMKMDKPWEEHVLHPNVLYDPSDRKYKMWYTCANWSNYFDPTKQAYYVAYAESTDGFTWVKPALFPFEDYPATNVVQFTKSKHLDRLNGLNHVRLHLDAKDPKKRFSALCGKKLTHVYSADGLHWEIAGEPMLGYGSDFANHMLWVEEARKWFLYVRPSNDLIATGWGTKTESSVANLPEGNRHTRRRVSLSTSSDQVNWSKPRVVLYPDEAGPPDYDMAFIFRRHGVFIGLYDPLYQDKGEGEQEVHLATSRDGIHWQRTWDRKPFVPRGPAGSWDHGHVSVSISPPVEMGDNLVFYYSGAPVGQNPEYAGWEYENGFGIFRIRKDRFIGHWAERETTGYLLTRQFVLEGSKLRINCISVPRAYDQPENGIFVEIVAAPEPSVASMGVATPVAGFRLEDCDRIRVDQVNRLVTWKGNSDLTSLRGKAVYLRFKLKDAALFSFQIED
jgi:hypothetical protein